MSNIQRNTLIYLQENSFKYLYWILLLFYILMYTPYGFEDGDMGTIFSISWSMYNGYFPFTDFTYIKPPFSPYFHSLFLYITEDYAYLINRGFYYIQVFMYSYLAASLLCKTFRLYSKNTIYLIAILGALISIHNYPPTPWNTVDGVFFSVIGTYFLLSKKETLWRIVLGALFVSLGVLCKQSFFFFPVFLTAYLVLLKNYKKAGLFVASGLAFALLFVIILFLNGAWDAFYNQIFSFTPTSSFIETAIKVYYLALKFNYLLIIGLLLVFFLAKKYLSKHITFLYSFGSIAAIFLYLYLHEDSFHTVKKALMQALLVISIIYALYYSRNDKRYWFLLLLLSLSWCAAISNGFNTPIHFSGPIAFTIFIMSYDLKTFKFSKVVGAISILFFVVVFYVGYQNVYMDSNRKELTYNMGAIYPQLSCVKSDKSTFEKYSELKNLSQYYTNYTILPSVTLGHYLTKTKNPIGVDWVFNHHLANQIQVYVDKLEDKNVTVFLENFENHVHNYEESSLLTVYVKDNWKLIEKRNYFRVYRKP